MSGQEGGTNRIWCVCGLNSRAIEKKSHGAGSLALTFAKGAHQLLELCGALNLEEDLVIVVGDLDIKVFRIRSGLLAGGTVRVLVRHGG